MTAILTPSFELSRRIGNTNYEASVFFSPTATETFEQKFLRMILTGSLDSPKHCGTIETPQMSRPA